MRICCTLIAGNVGNSIVIVRPEIALTGDQLNFFLKLEMTCNDGRARENNFQSPTQSRGKQARQSGLSGPLQVDVFVKFYIRR